MRLSNSLLLGFVIAASAPGCFVVDKNHLHDTLGQGDGGADGGGIAAADLCGQPQPLITIPASTLTAMFQADTTNLTNSPSPPDSCDGVGAGGLPGNDGFYRFDVVGGQYYHFHVAPASAARDPAIYMLPTNCDTTSCGVSIANRCGVGDPEHFGFRFPANGTWYLAIDDKLSGGGVYDVTAIRPVCGNGTKEHGENCDYMAPILPGAPQCDMQCRAILSAPTATESELNEDIFLANSVQFTATSPLVVTATLSGCDSDAFAMNVSPADHIVVQEQPTGGATLCRAAPTDRGMTMKILSASGSPIAQGAPDSNGCLVFDQVFTGTSSQEMIVLIEFPNHLTALPYGLKFSR